MCHMSCVTCHVSHVMCHTSFYLFIFIFLRTKWWSLSVEGLLSTGLTPSSFYNATDCYNVVICMGSWIPGSQHSNSLPSQSPWFSPRCLGLLELLPSPTSPWLSSGWRSSVQVMYWIQDTAVMVTAVSGYSSIGISLLWDTDVSGYTCLRIYLSEDTDVIGYICLNIQMSCYTAGMLYSLVVIQLACYIACMLYSWHEKQLWMEIAIMGFSYHGIQLSWDIAIMEYKYH